MFGRMKSCGLVAYIDADTVSLRSIFFYMQQQLLRSSSQALAVSMMSSGLQGQCSTHELPCRRPVCIWRRPPTSTE